MVNISFLRPVDQPSGTRRLLPELQACLASDYYMKFQFAVAFAKSGPLLRLFSDFKQWRAADKTIEGIFGIDHLGTSRQALEFALENFDRVFIIHMEVPSRVTFHPKLYLFSGDQRAVCFYGSHNLTVGGTETNFEGGVKIELDRPEDNETFIKALDCWESLLPERCKSTLPLDDELLDKLSRGGFLLDENKGYPISKVPRPAISLPSTTGSPSLFPLVSAKPPSAIPRYLIAPSPSRSTPERSVPDTEVPVAVQYDAPASQTLVIQIVPQHQGEVRLSKIALNENPDFFDYPFSGRTRSKKAKNPPYSQREPDPVVNINVYGSNGQLIVGKPVYHMNTVCYDRKGEVRVTFSPDVKAAIEPFSIMVMTKNSPSAFTDYDISIFNPDSQQYRDYYEICNLDLPKGNLPQARKIGWL